MSNFIRLKEFSCRLEDVVKVVPHPENKGCYLYILNHKGISHQPCDREYVSAGYDAVMDVIMSADHKPL